MRRVIVCLATLMLVLSACTTDGRPVAESAPTDGRGVPPPLMLILDGSGSMTTQDAPGPRIDAAKRAAVTLVGGLPDTTEVGLMTYGTTTGSADADRELGCRDVQVLTPLAELNREETTQKINSIAPSGYTPIALALRTAAADLPQSDDPKSIILVSDGEDTCGEPPCAVAEELAGEHPGLVISTIGFKTEGVATDDLACIAHVTGGEFVSADNPGQLAARLDVIVDPDLTKQTLTTTGFRGMVIGMTAEEARQVAESAGSSLAPVAMHGKTDVDWIDCSLGFVDGVLVAITPVDGTWTIDGLKVGVDASRAIARYPPSGIIYNPGTTATVVYPADDRIGTGFRITYEPTKGAQPSGVITRITLCRCKPTVLPGILTPDYREKPSLSWQTAPGQAGGRAFGDPRTYYGAREDTGFIQTDELIIVNARGAPADRAVVGVDASDGSIRWASGPQPGYEGGCSDELPGGRIACGGNSGFTFLSTEDGSHLSSAPVNGNYHSVVQVGDTLAYLSSEGDTPVVEGGTASDAAAYWRISGIPADTSRSYWESNGVVGTYCSSSVRGVTSLAFDEEGREVLPATDNGCYFVTTAGDLGETSDDATRIYSSDGTLKFSADGPVTRPETVFGGGDLLFTGEGAYDRSGAMIWRSEELSEEPFEASVIAVVGDVVVVQHQYRELVGLSAQDGTVLWRTTGVSGYDNPLTDGQRIVTYDDDAGLIAYDVADGSVAWTVPEAAGLQYGKLAASNGRIVLIGAESIQGYAPPER